MIHYEFNILSPKLSEILAFAPKIRRQEKEESGGWERKTLPSLPCLCSIDGDGIAVAKSMSLER